jgi:hypothetical protein
VRFDSTKACGILTTHENADVPLDGNGAPEIAVVEKASARAFAPAAVVRSVTFRTPDRCPFW